MTDIEDFFSSYANSEVPDFGDDEESLLEIAELMLPRFYVEILEMNDGRHYLLQIFAHERDGWNIDDQHPHEWKLDHAQRSLYRFPTKEGVIQALTDFQLAVI